MENEATKLLSTLNDALDKGLDQIPAIAENMIESISMYYWVSFWGFAVLGIVMMFILTASLILSTKTKINGLIDVGIGMMIVSAIGMVISILGLLINLPRALSPIGYMLSRML